MDKHIQQIKLFLRALFVFTFEGSSGQWASGQWEIGCLNFTWQATPHLERRLQALAPKKAHYFKPHYRLLKQKLRASHKAWIHHTLILMSALQTIQLTVDHRWMIPLEHPSV
ncbi:hypothetical protein O6H91_04G100600 [Diphasiastrum complanatum]|uniref:Uncharacterized protein n=1 Tax=Diphasiastrum complanatum TaxID=34168 RepID=A0ACC2E085_DIPCM|nr:hypothetical protein O6H91_04G100600 [Diphasiastrum complanatum]